MQLDLILLVTRLLLLSHWVFLYGEAINVKKYKWKLLEYHFTVPDVRFFDIFSISLLCSLSSWAFAAISEVFTVTVDFISC